MSERLWRDEIPEREGFLQGPRGERKGSLQRSEATAQIPHSPMNEELEAFSYSFRGRPAINTISSSRTTIKKKEPPKDDSPNRRRSAAHQGAQFIQ